MAGRLAWIAAGGAAILGGMMFQGDGLFGVDVRGEDGRDRSVSVHVAEKVEGKTERLVDRMVAEHGDDVEYQDHKGRTVELDRETKIKLARAVGDLVKAEARLALFDFKNEEDTPEGRTARKARDDAQATIDRLEAEIKSRTGASPEKGNEVRDDIRREVRQGIQAAIRS